MFVYPQPGVLVRDPDKRDLIPKEGREVDGASPYWIRRLSDKDITTEKPADAPLEAQAVAAASSPRVSAKPSGPASTETDSGSNNA